jgi:hypothetical protein
MQDMISYMSCPQDQIAYDTAIVGDLIRYAKGAVKVQRSGSRMAGRADPAYALCYPLCVPGVPAFKDQFQAAKQGAGASGIFYLVVFYNGLNPEMTFNTRYWIDYYFGQLIKPPDII